MKSKNLRRAIKKLPTISVSLLNCDLANLKNIVKKLESLDINVLHLDIMDGSFVPNLTFGPPLIKCLRKYTKCFFDVHLMIEQPQKSVQQYINAGAELVVFHYEALDEQKIQNLIFKIKNNNIFCGISIKPKTEVPKIYPYLKYLDLVLVMTVEPGFGGQKILTECVSKIKLLDEYRKKEKLQFLISADGGINENNIREIIKLGCDLPVVGNAIFSVKNFGQKVKIFQSLTKIQKFNSKVK